MLLRGLRFGENAQQRPTGRYLRAKIANETVLSADRISQRFDLQNSRDVYQSMDQFMADVKQPLESFDVNDC